jgi:hypothetical protein
VNQNLFCCWWLSIRKNNSRNIVVILITSCALWCRPGQSMRVCIPVIITHTLPKALLLPPVGEIHWKTYLQRQIK